jgi:phytoene synthase
VGVGAPIVVGQDRLQDGYVECAEIARRRARNFYYGLRLTPEPRRSAIYSIYAWMRTADDEADAQVDAAERRACLAKYRELTARVLAGQPPPAEARPYWWAFAATAATYPIDVAIFSEMLDGLEEDIDHGGYATEADLWRYCYRVASTVGLVCVSIWGLGPGVDTARVRELAVRRGQAFQRTNILRDFAQDYDSRPRRVYLPQEAFAKAGLTPEKVRAWEDPGACRRFMLEQAAGTRAEYKASEGLEKLIDPACAPTLWAMTKIYSGLLEVIEADPERIVGGKRVRLASARKASIALAATWRARTGRW